MDVTKMVYAIIGITVGVIVIATVLLPEISEVVGTADDKGPAYEYGTLLGVVGTLSIIAIVMIAVRLMGGSKN